MAETFLYKVNELLQSRVEFPTRSVIPRSMRILPAGEFQTAFCRTAERLERAYRRAQRGEAEKYVVFIRWVTDGLHEIRNREMNLEPILNCFSRMYRSMGGTNEKAFCTAPIGVQTKRVERISRIMPFVLRLEILSFHNVEVQYMTSEEFQVYPYGDDGLAIAPSVWDPVEWYWTDVPNSDLSLFGYFKEDRTRRIFFMFRSITLHTLHDGARIRKDILLQLPLISYSEIRSLTTTAANPLLVFLGKSARGKSANPVSHLRYLTITTDDDTFHLAPQHGDLFTEGHLKALRYVTVSDLRIAEWNPLNMTELKSLILKRRFDTNPAGFMKKLATHHIFKKLIRLTVIHVEWSRQLTEFIRFVRSQLVHLKITVNEEEHPNLDPVFTPASAFKSLSILTLVKVDWNNTLTNFIRAIRDQLVRFKVLTKSRTLDPVIFTFAYKKLKQFTYLLNPETEVDFNRTFGDTLTELSFNYNLNILKIPEWKRLQKLRITNVNKIDEHNARIDVKNIVFYDRLHTLTFELFSTYPYFFRTNYTRNLKVLRVEDCNVFQSNLGLRFENREPGKFSDFSCYRNEKT